MDQDVMFVVINIAIILTSNIDTDKPCVHCCAINRTFLEKFLNKLYNSNGVRILRKIDSWLSKIIHSLTMYLLIAQVTIENYVYPKYQLLESQLRSERVENDFNFTKFVKVRKFHIIAVEHERVFRRWTW